MWDTSGLKRIRDKPERSVKVEAVWNAIKKGAKSHQGLERGFSTPQQNLSALDYADLGHLKSMLLGIQYKHKH